MKRQAITTERLIEIIEEQKRLFGDYVWTDRRKTAEEMLKMRGVGL